MNYIFALSCVATLLFSLSSGEKAPVATFGGSFAIRPLLEDDPENATAPVSAPGLAPGLYERNTLAGGFKALNDRAVVPADDPEATRYGPLWNADGCTFCPEQKLQEMDAATLLRTLTVAKMKSYMRGTQGDLYDKCIFYTRADDRPPNRLSGLATEWACNHDKYSIWHLWPNALMVRGYPDRYDFYGIYEDGNVFNKINKDLPIPTFGPSPTIQYFERMSRAMAESCSGEILVATQRPLEISKYSDFRNDLDNSNKNIWGTQERPALVTRRRRGTVTAAYIIDINTDEVYDYDIIADRNLGKSSKVFKRSLYADDLPVNGTDGSGLRRRADFCDTSGVGSEIAGADYFAGNYDEYP